MKNNRIAVISADADWSTFFSWEARACGCFVQVFSTPPQTLEGFDLAVLDVRVGPCLPDHGSCRLAVVTAEPLRDGFSMADTVWEWPVSVRAVREAYEGTLGQAVDEPQDERAVPAIYLLSERERTVLYRNRVIVLTESEWRLLCALGEPDGEVVSRERLADTLGTPDGNAVKVHLCHLRRKLEEPFGVRLVETVRGCGYRLRLPLKNWK